VNDLLLEDTLTDSPMHLRLSCSAEQKVLTAFERREQEKVKRLQAKELEEVRAR
jgi:hypothetical protein